MNVCVTTAFDAGYQEMGDLCAEALRRYAAQHDMVLRIHGSLPDTGRPPAWAKIRIIQALLNEGFEFILWVDADAVVVDMEPDIRDEVRDGKDLFLVKHVLTVHPMPGMVVTLDVPNTGIMLLRNSDWTDAILHQLWDYEEYVSHRWWENAALIHLMGYHRLLRRDALNVPDPVVLARVRWLDPRWNVVPDAGAPVPRPIIRHHTRGASRQERVAAMRADLDQAMARAEQA